MTIKSSVAVALTVASVALTPETMAQDSDKTIFSQPYGTVHETIPFSRIDNSVWIPAVDRGIREARKEVDAIVRQRSTPDFENTIVALENSGAELNRVLNAFFPLVSANADEQLMDISVDVSRKLSDFSTAQILNEGLWRRIRDVYDNRSKFNLSPEDSMLLQTTYDSFALSGANLQGEDREKFKKMSSELSELTTRFGQNVLKELNTYQIWLDKNQIAGLPKGVVDAAAEAAKAKGRDGEYLFGLDQPTYMAVMKYADDDAVREKFYRLYSGRNTKGEFNNVEILKRIADLRRQIANLLGRETYADHSLTRTMAQNPANVYRLLNQLREAYRPALDKEMQELTAYATAQRGTDTPITPWNYSYWSNKHRADKYNFDEEALRPYFELDNVINGVFGLATRLYGLHFTYNPDIEVYHPDVKAFEVTDDNGEYIGIIYTDFFPRDTKSPGAWMTNFKEQWIDADGNNSRPHVSIVMNFTKPTSDTPSLLTPYEAETFLHEFGHSLHGLLADTKYHSLSGTSVYRDFVELPSQFNENYLTQREYLNTFAKHYKTGEAIPDSLVNGLVTSSQYGAAYSCMRQLMFGFLDMAWHSTRGPVDDAVEFEAEAIRPVQIFEPVEGSMVSPQFSHIFAGGYAAGYYSYKWAEVLDADAFSVFKKNGIFDRKTADSFRNNILKRGGTENPADLYRRFRGGEPTIDALLRRDGIIKDEPKPAPVRIKKD